MEEYIFGVDLGGTSIKLGLFTAGMQLTEKWEIPARSQNAGEHILEDMAAAMEQKLDQLGIPRGQLRGIGLGVPGTVLGRSFVEPCANLNGWGDFDVGAALARRFGCPVKVANDANAAALGELLQGSGKGCRNMVMVTLGTGVGGGIIIDGRLLEGANGAAGELGHMKMDPTEQAVCGCGKRGCLEQYASATGILRTAKRLLAQSDAPSALRQAEPLTAKDVLDQAKAGDPLAAEAAQQFADCLGRALAMVACVCNPEVLLLGGGVSKAGDYLVELLRPAFEKYAFTSAEGTLIRLAALGNDAGIFGAAGLMLE